MFVDASALVAIIREEPEADRLTTFLSTDRDRLTSGVAIWEAARALGRSSDAGIEGGLLEAERYCASLRIVTVPVGSIEAIEAVRAHARYGKGTGHPARLNMGDCLASACAKTNGARLLYKSNDFIHTDLA